jgi:hypothetical protein
MRTALFVFQARFIHYRQLGKFVNQAQTPIQLRRMPDFLAASICSSVLSSVKQFFPSATAKLTFQNAGHTLIWRQSSHHDRALRAVRMAGN